jgi:hypothetical protein
MFSVLPTEIWVVEGTRFVPSRSPLLRVIGIVTPLWENKTEYAILPADPPRSSVHFRRASTTHTVRVEHGRLSPGRRTISKRFACIERAAGGPSWGILRLFGALRMAGSVPFPGKLSVSADCCSFRGLHPIVVVPARETIRDALPVL